jgi:preprotein translocase subunit SecD
MALGGSLMKEGWIDFFKDYRVILLIALIIVSIGSISVYGIQQGLDLQGGSLIQIHLDQPVDQPTMNKVTAVLDKRLNLFGVKDVKVRQSGDQDVIVEIAGVQPQDVASVVGTTGKFEAKIGNETALEGSDITTVDTPQVTSSKWEVPFKISTDAANKFAQVAKGKAGQPVDMYMDDKVVSSPELSDDLANGVASTDVEVSGGASSKSNAETQAKQIQTVLESGALPVKVNIAGISSVSADLGSQFKNGAIVAGIIAVIVISLIIIIRYKSPKLVVPIIFTSLVEVLLILGVASIIKWNIDLSAIAGIIAAIGTGVDDQIIITDEVLKGTLTEKSKRRSTAVKVKIKHAFFIVFASAGTLVAAMLPLAYIGFARGSSGIGVLAGFAFTTIIGVLIGVFITRPVFAKFIEQLLRKGEPVPAAARKTTPGKKGKNKKGKKGKR